MAARMAVAASAALVLLAAALCVHARNDPGFIRVANGVFVDNTCHEFHFSGYNTWEPIEAAVDKCCGGPQSVVQQFQRAVENDFSVVRMFGFPVLEGFNLQERPGQYNETAFKGLDYVIAEAGKNGIKLIIAFMNNWNYNPLQTDWKCAYTNWTTTAHGCDDFFTNPEAIQLYKNHVKKVVSRVNTYNNVMYRDDPTILGWDLINEPRSAAPTGAADIQSFVSTVAPYVKSVDPNHLVTVGEDGFYQASDCQSNTANPVPNSDGWPLKTGQDFMPNHIVDGIDYASIHLWPDNWARIDMDFGHAWVAAHINNTQLLGKPLVMEEFGKAVGAEKGTTYGAGQTAQQQYDYYKMVYSFAQQSIDIGTGLKGVLFWRWAAVDETATLGGLDSAATINTTSPVFQQVILPFSKRVAAAISDPNRPIVEKCTVINASPGELAHPNTAAPITLAQAQPQQPVRQASTIPAGAAPVPAPASSVAASPAAAPAPVAPTFPAATRRSLMQAAAQAAAPDTAPAAQGAPQLGVYSGPTLPTGPAALSRLTTPSTFATPPGVSAANINTLQQCPAAQPGTASS